MNEKIASIFISIIMVTSLYTSMQTNAAVISNFSIIMFPPAPGAPTYSNIIDVLNNECDLVIANLSNCIFIIHHPKRLQTSTFIELGYALALKKIIIIISSPRDLPYLANGIVDFESVFYLESQEITKDIMQQIISIINKI